MHTLWLIAVLAGWPAPEAGARATARVVVPAAYQTKLPAPDVPFTGPVQPPPERHREGAEATEAVGSAAAEIFLWIVAALSAVGVIAAVVASQPGWHRSRRPQDGGAPVGPVSVARQTLDDARALARAGRFAEAAHALLLRTFEALGRQAALSPALTSREILGQVPLTPEAFHALRALVQTVEVSLFGGAEVSAEDFARCEAAFERVLAARGVRAT